MKLEAIISCVVIFFSTFQENIVSSEKNNACRSYLDYYFVHQSKDCYYIPDANNDVPEIIERHIGLHEKHEVITEDGYILDLFRISRLNPKGVILFQHPLGVDSKIWVNQFNESTAFIFWKAGYDVWLGNSRGTLYGKKHASLTHTDRKFWDHSFHEMGLYDHNATIEYIKQKTNVSKIIFIGHSMATTSSLVYASMRPKEAAESVRVIISMAPIAFLKHITSPTVLIGRFLEFVQPILRLLGIYSLLYHESWYLQLARIILSTLPMKRWIIYLISVFCGWTPENYDIQYYNMMIYQFGSEVSLKVFDHYTQIVNSNGRFQLYDYGKKKNLKMYGSGKPPLYPIEKIETPIYLVQSPQDIVSHPKDVELLYEKLPKQAKIYGKLTMNGLNHLDFHFGINRINNVYKKLLDFLHNL